ncbi:MULTISPECIES: fumarylacetoacetate hydrolase family protein [unclassified Mycobacterium]|uniref:fumarylacetoacetate hydrolase family protein n=1 Tax=unclassified Mycobacterium TaxID=2642494 RepID=UPI0029C65E27|nr:MULTISPECIES: fumarylacetoacetate hydrolase family protein [unclassified Mycobacterium]
MRLLRYRTDGRPAAGVVLGDVIAPIDGPDDIVAIIAGDPDATEAARRAARRATATIPLTEVRVLAPLPHPSKYLAVGFNSAAHVAEAATEPISPARAARMATNRLLHEAYPDPRWPQLFNKQTTCVQEPYGPIWKPADATTLDYEGEVALVIGRRLRRASRSQAREAIAGYVVANDVSVREWQFETAQIWLGKSFETHGPLGPWVTSADEVDEDGLRIRTWVNGELRQDGRFADQLHGACEIVSMCSEVCTLLPGDVIATGTPAGVGAASERYLGIGDVVRVAVDGLGHLENTVVAEPGDQATTEANGV